MWQRQLEDLHHGDCVELGLPIMVMKIVGRLKFGMSGKLCAMGSECCSIHETFIILPCYS